MTTTPGTFAPRWPDDPRTPIPPVAGERETLAAYLDWHRATLEMKCTGVPSERLSDKGVPPSGLSLHGLVRHLAGVERWWFRVCFAGEDVPLLYYSDEDPNQDFDSLAGDPADALAAWRVECDRSREIVAAAASLEEKGTRVSGDPFTLRWLMVRMIAEYAQHNGHGTCSASASTARPASDLVATSRGSASGGRQGAWCGELWSPRRSGLRDSGP